ncbi:hypothetical protein CAPTEDRAFT_217062 [Capitella teleta]|uniref:Uncharacterized protein n=1 Tax=Capitella teleta TaxID=283909 RepID=R7U8Y0_CAPTE|nr:hypothetical protein CAPTEDRAFT_217062 [Capitella teleta]|eukprot:ELU02591.1 hypothetical protein CAPTEDRAFT_217062 [Capitella teleta]
MEFALIPGVRGYSDRFVLCLKKAGPGQITLSRGCETVRARIGTTALPTRLTFGKPFLERLLSKVVQHESRVPEPVWTKGGAFTAAAMRRILSVNSRLLDRENRFEDLVEAGDMTLLDIPTVNHAREIVAREKDELAFASRPELNGKLRLTFRLYDGDGRPAAPDDAFPKDGGPTTVGNFGKTHTMTTELVNKYKAIFMNDANNAMCLPKTAQFIVPDEVGLSNRVGINQLKGLTSGNAAVASFNRKSYGESYVPRWDSQIVVITNHSIYDTYAVRDGRTGLRKVKHHVIEPLLCRFHVIRLDGDDREERTEFYDPKELSQEDYLWSLNKAFYSAVHLAASVGRVSTVVLRAALRAAMNVHRLRHPENMPTTKSLARDLALAIDAQDFVIVSNAINRFCTDVHIPQSVQLQHEYTVELIGDPKRDVYAEMVEGMAADPILVPDFAGRGELTEDGPVENPARDRAVVAALERIKQRKARRPRPGNAKATPMMGGRAPIQDPPSPAPSDSEDDEPVTVLVSPVHDPLSAATRPDPTRYVAHKKMPSPASSDSEDDEPAPSHLPVPPPPRLSAPLPDLPLLRPASRMRCRPTRR